MTGIQDHVTYIRWQVRYIWCDRGYLVVGAAVVGADVVGAAVVGPAVVGAVVVGAEEKLSKDVNSCHYSLAVISCQIRTKLGEIQFCNGQTET